MKTLWSGNATVDQIQNCPVRIVESDNILRVEAAYDGNSSYSEVTTPIEARTFSSPQPDQSLIQRLTDEHRITQSQTAGAGTSSGGGDSGQQYSGTGMGFNRAR